MSISSVLQHPEMPPHTMSEAAPLNQSVSLTTESANHSFGQHHHTHSIPSAVCSKNYLDKSSNSHVKQDVKCDF